MFISCSRAGVHEHGSASEKLAKRYLLMLETVVKMRSKELRKEGPPKLLLLREVLSNLSAEATSNIVELVRSRLKGRGRKYMRAPPPPPASAPAYARPPAPSHALACSRARARLCCAASLGRRPQRPATSAC